MNWKLIRIIDTCLGIPLVLGLSLINGVCRKSGSYSGSVKRILLIKFWGIGNIFMILPSIHALRKTYPDASIDFLTLEVNREALDTLGAVDRIVTISTSTISAFIGTWKRSVSGLRNNDYDIVIDFEQFARFSALVSFQIGARNVIGFNTGGQHRGSLYTLPVPYNNNIHITRSFYALACSAGCGSSSVFPRTEFARLDNLRRRGHELLAGYGIGNDELTLVMHVGTSDNFSERRWPPERYAELAELLIRTYHMRVVFTGLEDESPLVRETMSYLHSPEAAVDLSGQLSFGDYFALIAVADLVISADTAAVHMASLIDVPVIGLYGPNIPDLYGPWGSKGLAIYQQFDCSPCITNFNAKLHTCRHADGRGACMRAITVEFAFEKIYQQYLAPEAPLRLERLTGT